MIKRLLNRSKDYLFALPAYESSCINQLKGKVSCLLYHRVEDYGNYEFLDNGGSPVINEADFDRELTYLKQLPTKFYTLADLSSGHFPDKDTIGIVICFDDCFKCNYTEGLNVLKKHNTPAVFFQCTGFINAPTLNWEHLLYWLYFNPDTRSILIERLNHEEISNDMQAESIFFARENLDSKFIQQLTHSIIDELGLNEEISNLARKLYPDEEMIINTHKLGHEIASHGHNHYKRETISHETFEFDLNLSSVRLGELLGKPANAYSYPFNSYTLKDHDRVSQYYKTIANVAFDRINKPVDNHFELIPRLTWPGLSSNQLRMKRWLLSGKF